MNSISTHQFGLIIAYLLPGFVALAGLAPLVPAVAQWLQPVHDGVLGFGPPLYALLAATTMSQIINCFRWILLDQFHAWSGLRSNATDFGQLQGRTESFDYLVQNHYRYYQFAGNMFVAVFWSYGISRLLGTSGSLGWGTDLGILVLLTVLFLASRDALSKYYSRTHRLLEPVADKGELTMYNGIGHHDGGGDSTAPKKPVTEAKPPAKAPAPTKPTPAIIKESKSRSK